VTRNDRQKPIDRAVIHQHHQPCEDPDEVRRPERKHDQQDKQRGVFVLEPAQVIPDRISEQDRYRGGFNAYQQRFEKHPSIQECGPDLRIVLEGDLVLYDSCTRGRHEAQADDDEQRHDTEGKYPPDRRTNQKESVQRRPAPSAGKNDIQSSKSNSHRQWSGSAKTPQRISAWIDTRSTVHDDVRQQIPCRRSAGQSRNVRDPQQQTSWGNDGTRPIAGTLSGSEGRNPIQIL
jgi:hypothetical protein